MNGSWLFENSRQFLPAPWGVIVFALVSALCGLIIGAERQKHEKSVGLRTLALVTLGAAVFTMASYAFTTTTGDSGRVAAQIVTGIGFLGAGVILHGRYAVSGMTTAATIWVAAAIGIVVGVGYPIAGLALSVLVVLLLHGVYLYEIHFISRIKEVRVTLEYSPEGGKTRVRLERVIVDAHLPLTVAEWHEEGQGQGEVTLRIHLAATPLAELLDALVDVPTVRSITREKI